MFLFKTLPLEKNRKIKTSGITKAVFQNVCCPTFVTKKKKNLNFDAKMMSCDVAMQKGKKNVSKLNQSKNVHWISSRMFQIFVLQYAASDNCSLESGLGVSLNSCFILCCCRLLDAIFRPFLRRQFSEALAAARLL